jgi:hypothetical protein
MVVPVSVSEVTAQLRSVVDGLSPQTAIVIPSPVSLIVAMTPNGPRVGHWSGIDALWWRGNFDSLMSRIDACLDWTQAGHFAADARREIVAAVSSPCVLGIRGIGRRRVELTPVGAGCGKEKR